MSLLDLDQHPDDQMEKDKHAYSCKRCRRLKKKCTRSMPKCLNCTKAGEFCEYVPRAPRRKKNEILKSINQQKSNTGHVPLAPNLSSTKYTNNLNFNGSYTNPSNQFNNPPTPNYNSLSNGINLNSSTSNNALFPLIPRARSVSESSASSAKPFAYGTTDPLSYSQIDSFNFASLPPISAITNSMSGAQNELASLSQGFNFNTASLSQSFGSFSGSTSQFPFHKIPSSAPSPQSSISSVDSHLIRRMIPSTANLQNKMLNTVMGINSNAVPGTVIRPDIPRSLVIQCADAYFNDFSRPFPFLKKSDYLERIHAIDFETLENMDPNHTFDIYMVLLIGYCSLERKKKIPTDKALKEHLIHKSLEQVSLILTYDNITSIRQLMFLGIYSYFEEAGNVSWYLAGVITRLAMSLGLNRKPTSPNFHEDSSEEELEMRKRMFWSVYNFDRQVSVALGRPVALDDDDINLAPYNALPYEEPDEIRLLNAIVDLRRVEGKIMKNVHSVNSGLKIKSEEQKIQLINDLRKEVEDWYSTISTVTCTNKRLTLSSCSVSWYSACYYQLLLLLYRPSFLVPNPSHETMEVVGKACLQSIAYIYNLHQIHLLPLNWVQLHRLLSISTTLIHCLIINSIDMVEVKTELTLGVELSEYYCDKWTIAKKVVNIMKQINHTIFDAKLGYGFNIREREDLSKKLLLFGHQYYEALNDSQVEIWHDDPVISNIRNIEV